MNVSTLRGLVVGATLALGFAALAPTSAQAQGVRFGVEAAWANDFDLGVGAFGKFGLTEISEKAITGRVSFDYFFPGKVFGVSQKYWELNGDALLDIVNKKSSVKPYVGAGVVYSHYSVDIGCGTSCSGSSNDFGLNLLGGLNFGNSKMMPFVEAKYEIRSGGEFVLKAGLHF